jgi:hypothetical protein
MTAAPDPLRTYAHPHALPADAAAIQRARQVVLLAQASWERARHEARLAADVATRKLRELEKARAAFESLEQGSTE